VTITDGKIRALLEEKEGRQKKFLQKGEQINVRS